MLKQITIHKNMSLKDIKPQNDHFKRITPLKIIHMAKNQTQEVQKRYLTKNGHVNLHEKNYFSFNAIQQLKRQLLCVSHQPNNKNKERNKKLNDRYVDDKVIQDQEQKIKQQGYEKQNLIPTINLKNTQHLIKNSKKSFYNTQKYQSLKHIQIYGVTEPSQNKNIKKKLLNNISKTKLSKLPTQQNQYIITEQSQKIEEQYSKGFPKTFRKGILQHIFHVSKHKQKGIHCPKIKNDSIVGSLSLAESRVEIQQTVEGDHYPQSQRSITTNNAIFASECSTIEQKIQNNSSFISKKGINNLIQTIDQNIECSILDLKDKRRKLDFDKFKKKFPQNFFK